MSEGNGEMRKLPADKLTEVEIEALEETIVLDPVELDGAILGSTLNDAGERILVYEYEKLIEIYAGLDGDPNDEERFIGAQEWVDFNSIRALPYMGPRAPLIVTRLEEGDEEAMELDERDSLVELIFTKPSTDTAHKCFIHG